ncbi:MAG: methylated-DNA--protein-cysteine methyltransferase [Betaproteobacteria bacterium]|nr:MAG: methylated-DNA--protein-cysteine methyltransferase [Betaproteobacteria bacterium]
MNDSMWHRTIASPVGPLRASTDGRALVALAFDGAPVDGGTAPPAPAAAVLDRAASQLAEWFAGARTTFELPLAPRGTPFQRAVWDALLAIPYGTTASYADVARRVGRPAATRAVGAANGRNPIAIVVPCHRVIGADGTLGGYAGGLARKQALLAHEARHAFALAP